MAEWIDLLDPTPDELRSRAPRALQPPALELLLREPAHDDEPRPTMQGHGDYCFGVFLVAVVVPEDDQVFYQELDVVLTRDTLLTVRKTPPNGRPPYVPEPLSAARANGHPGMMLYRLLDDIAEKYLDLVDDLDSEIDELEDRIEMLDPDETHDRISALRHDLLRVRRTLSPMRDAVHRIVDGVVEVEEEGEEVFERDVQVAFNGAYDKFLRAVDGLEISRDLLAGVRDYHQAKVAIEQNEAAKRLTAIASILLVPTFIVGLYGQNFIDIPELKWHWGYEFSWGLIIATTVIQIWYFRRKGWL